MKTYIKLHNVNFEYLIYSEYSKNLKYEALSLGSALKKNKSSLTVQALKNINLDIQEGSKIGLLGANGSGKTTLLRVLSQIYPPTSGKVLLSGNINSMITLNEGFDNNLTGRELTTYKYLLNYNAYPSEKVYDQIKEISELEDWYDLPLYSYSSGMLMRLLFAIQMSFQSDILLFDEWLSVGDRDFQLKCRDIINDKLTNNKIFVIASHNQELVNTICNVRIYLHKGEIVSIERN